MKDPRILIMGATGKTGRSVVKHLLSHNISVRLLVHRPAEAIALFGEHLVDIVEGDMRDSRAVRRALTGIESAYFCYPILSDFLTASTTFAMVGREVGLQTVVNLSQSEAQEGARSPASQLFWLTERLFEESSFATTHLHPTFFMDNLLQSVQGGRTASSTIALPCGTARYAPVAAEDVGRVAAQILLDPAPHAGQTYRLTGSQEFSLSEAAVILSTKLAQLVRYVDTSPEEWRHTATKIGLDPYLVNHLVIVYDDFRRGAYRGVTDKVATIGKMPPLTLEDFIRKAWPEPDSRPIQ